jgi:hypothetical protein
VSVSSELPAIGYCVKEKDGSDHAASSAWLGDMLGKVCIVDDPSDAKQKSTVSDEDEKEVLKQGKMMQSPLWAWKGQLVKIRAKIAQALGDVSEGLKDFGLLHKPIWSAGHLKGSKSKPKLWVLTRSKPKPNPELG